MTFRSPHTDTTDSSIDVMNTDQVAAFFRAQGVDIAFAHGHYWRRRWGFYQPVHLGAIMGADEARRPTHLCWGFYALLRDEDAERASVRSPIHLIKDLSEYDEASLTTDKRRQLRRASENMTLVRLTNASILHEQGWPIYQAKVKRVGLSASAWSHQQYATGASRLIADRRWLVFAAMRQDQLLGYMVAFAAEETGHFWDLYVPDGTSSRDVSVFLHYEIAQLFRLNNVKRLCAGSPLLDRTGVGRFKTEMGIPLEQVPAVFWSIPPAETLLRRLMPYTHYRITGESPRPAAAGGQ
ncbi:MAG: hypothetical protein JXA57_01290 [Armatimonadetes bacterium]|nr:hypothetical protein [Armatimonadota bacterium]